MTISTAVDRSSLIPIITLYPPWSNWVGLGWKTIETRLHQRFRSLAGRQIAIHSALRWDPAAIDLARPYLSPSQLSDSAGFLHAGGRISWLGFVREFRPLTTADSPAALIDCSPASPARWGLVLEAVRALPSPIPARGNRGIWYHPQLRLEDQR